MTGAVGGIGPAYASTAWMPSRTRQTEESGETTVPQTAAPDQSKAAGQEPEAASGTEELTDDEKQQVRELKLRDSEVRRHEAAHMAAGGGITGGATFEFTVGPDGRSYAIGGEVSISISEGNTPQETIQKMQAVKRAALAPADPSGQDRAVAASAAAIESKARMEMANESPDKGESENPPAAIEAYSTTNANALQGQELDTTA